MKLKMLLINPWLKKNKKESKNEENKILNEDEIDLRSYLKLFGIKDFLSLFFTFIITLISFIYVLLKKSNN